jgi:hypothetical protein
MFGNDKLRIVCARDTGIVPPSLFGRLSAKTGDAATPSLG